MSTHRVDVIRIKEILPHPAADTLGIVNINGWTCCVKLDQFKVGDLACYIEPDYVVQTSRPEFSFLGKDGKTEFRIRVCRFRGVLSQGLIVPLDPSFGLNEGDNALEALGIKRYEPPEPFITGGNNEGGPSGIYSPKYDVESYQRYRECFVEGEPVVATEKLHGTNARYIYSSNSNRMYCGSRTLWKEKTEKSVWWKALKQNPWIEIWCKANPDKILYGEVFGQVQTLKYGSGQNEFFFAAFDILDKNRWLHYYEDLESISSVPDFKWVTEVYRGPFNEKLLMDEAEKDSVWPGAKHYREGIVIRPERERYDDRVGRVLLKIVSNRYMEKDKG